MSVCQKDLFNLIFTCCCAGILFFRGLLFNRYDSINISGAILDKNCSRVDLSNFKWSHIGL
jgi:hypothetical protein